MRHDVILGDATILIASPNRVTPYNFNWDCNFLAQITGNKKLHVFNGTHRTLLTQIELERFCAGGINSATYQPAREKDAAVYDLGPRDGVHIPYRAPHWVQNGDNVSVALSLKYELRSETRTAELYRVQHWARRRSLHPPPLERAGMAWQTAALALAAARWLRKLVRPSPRAGGRLSAEDGSHVSDRRVQEFPACITELSTRKFQFPCMLRQPAGKFYQTSSPTGSILDAGPL